MKFGEKVRDLRKKHSLTQDELAQCLGINKRTIIGWERDGRYPRSIEMLEKMADIFPVSYTHLLPCVFQRPGRGRYDRSVSRVFRKEAEPGEKALYPQSQMCIRDR